MERLQKVMAHAGVASRRKSESIIKEGRVTVNDKVVTDMGVQVKKDDLIKVDGVPIEREVKMYILLNKPRGTVSTVDDPKDRETVLDLIEGVEERIYPVGRLDYDTTGALLLTNDGELANMLMHPSYEFEKTYRAKVEGQVSKESLKQLQTGIEIEGELTAPARAKMISYDHKQDRTMVELVIHEGKNHQVKKMMAAVGHPVEKLTRTHYGFLTVTNLQAGEWRELKNAEVRQLYQAVQ